MKNELAKMVGENILRHRQRLGVSQSEAAGSVDAPQANWWGYENGKHLPSVTTLKRICEYFGVSSVDILGF